MTCFKENRILYDSHIEPALGYHGKRKTVGISPESLIVSYLLSTIVRE